MDVCRCCLRKSGRKISLFDASAIGIKTNCAEMLSTFTGCSSPAWNDGLPQNICIFCVSQIHQCYQFVIKYKHSFRVLSHRFPLRNELDEINTVTEQQNERVETASTAVAATDSTNAQTRAVPIVTAEVGNSARVELQSKENCNRNSRKEATIVSLKCETDESIGEAPTRNAAMEMSGLTGALLLTEVHIPRTINQRVCSLIYAKGKPAKSKAGKTANSLSRKYICTFCKQQFLFKRSLAKHKCNILGMFKCNLCDKEYKTYADLYKHNYHKHREPTAPKCSICNVSFSSSKEYRQHQLDEHRKVKKPKNPYKCTDCDKIFMTKGELNFHNRIHRTKKNSSGKKNSCSAVLTRRSIKKKQKDCELVKKRSGT